MFIDVQNQVWSSAALTATALSTYSIDGNCVPYTTGTSNGAKNDIGTGEPMAFVVTVGVAADYTSSNETYEFDIVTATDAALATSLTTLAQYVLSYSLLTAGAVIILPVPAGAVVQRYIGLKAILGGTTPTITVSAFLEPLSMIQKQAYYTSAIVVN